MSFYTAILYYRPYTPPQVTAHDLALFIDQLAAIGLWEDSSRFSLSVKFGSKINRDHRELHCQEFYPQISKHILVSSFRKRKVDLEISTGNLQDMLLPLRNNLGSIYRAEIQLGSLTEHDHADLSRINSPENEIDFLPCEVRLSIGPITLSALSSEEIVFGGWMAMSISGPGYLYPWTFAQTVQRFEQQPKIQRMMELCRSTWPVPHKPPTKASIRARKEHPEIWPYRELDKPLDWHWGICET